MNGASSARILNVNDSEPARYLIGRILRGAGFEVLEAATGAEGLRLAEGLLPDVAIVDVRLPDLSGHAVCQRLRSAPRTSTIRLIQTSAVLTTSDDRADGFATGADHYLPQPFEKRELIEVVRTALRLKTGEVESKQEAARLAQADARKTAFLSVLSHELRNPLASIALATQNLMKAGSRTESEEKSKQIIARQTRNMVRMVDELLDISRIERGKVDLSKERLDLRALVKQVVDAQAPVAEARGLSLSAALPDHPVWVIGDPMRLEQVLINLLSNAFKFSERDTAVAVALVAAQGKALLSVVDQGSGMDPGTLGKAFLPFEQGPNSVGRGGLGIGLALAHALVEMHGGAIEARSDGDGRGSSFEVTLPLLT